MPWRGMLPILPGFLVNLLFAWFLVMDLLSIFFTRPLLLYALCEVEFFMDFVVFMQTLNVFK